MSDLTSGVQRTGPHPARDITEMESRAEGHYAGALILDKDVLFTGTWETVAEFCSHTPPGGRRTFKTAAANAAYAYLAWTSHEALVGALKLCRQELYDDLHSHMSQEQFENDPTIRQIDAALNLARGTKP